MIDKEMQLRIRILLVSRGLNQAKISREIGVSESLVSQMLTGKHPVNGRVKQYLINKLGFTEQELTGQTAA